MPSGGAIADGVFDRNRVVRWKTPILAHVVAAKALLEEILDMGLDFRGLLGLDPGFVGAAFERKRPAKLDDVTLADSETIGFTEEQKLNITYSRGKFVENIIFVIFLVGDLFLVFKLF